jgi:OST-HTH/LOTUS domain
VAFRNACHKFTFTEVLRAPAEEAVTTPHPVTPTPVPPTAAPAPPPAPLEIPKAFLVQALEQSVDDAGWAHLGTFGSYLNKLQPEFDSRLYGYKKLSDLVRAKTDLFVTEERQSPGSAHKVMYLRAR